MTQPSQVGLHTFLRIIITETIGVDDGDCETEDADEDTNVKKPLPRLCNVYLFPEWRTL